jgi:hypothetical protein
LEDVALQRNGGLHSSESERQQLTKQMAWVSVTTLNSVPNCTSDTLVIQWGRLT